MIYRKYIRYIYITGLHGKAVFRSRGGVIPICYAVGGQQFGTNGYLSAQGRKAVGQRCRQHYGRTAVKAHQPGGDHGDLIAAAYPFHALVVGIAVRRYPIQAGYRHFVIYIVIGQSAFLIRESHGRFVRQSIAACV